MEHPEPVIVSDLFPEERSHLLAVLRGLTADQWNAPTVCGGWSVKDVAAHVLGGDLGKLSRSRDGFEGESPQAGEGLGAFLDRINQEWVASSHRLSPRVLCDLLEWSGREVSAYVEALDPDKPGEPVSWAGSGSAPAWLDVAREYTERWHHQQHIREAVGAEGLTAPRYLSPAIATFVYAIPHSYRDQLAPDGTSVQVRITGPSGGDWIILREQHDWHLYSGISDEPASIVTMDQDTAWRLFTNGISREDAEALVEIDGDTQLGRHLRNAVAIIV